MPNLQRTRYLLLNKQGSEYNYRILSLSATIKENIIIISSWSTGNSPHIATYCNTLQHTATLRDPPKNAITDLWDWNTPKKNPPLGGRDWIWSQYARKSLGIHHNTATTCTYSTTTTLQHRVLILLQQPACTEVTWHPPQDFKNVYVFYCNNVYIFYCNNVYLFCARKLVQPLHEQLVHAILFLEKCSVICMHVYTYIYIQI